jgi:hypothetical protein
LKLCVALSHKGRGRDNDHREPEDTGESFQTF